MLKEVIVKKLKNVKLEYSIYIKDLKNGTLCTINSDKKVPAASIIKLYVMAAAFNCVEAKKISLNERITVKKEEKVPYSIVTLLDDEDTFTLKDLIVLMIIQSDNTATNKIIDMVDMTYINNFIQQEGFKSTVLQRKMMDSLARKNGRENYTSAEDVAVLLEKIYLGKLINKKYSYIMEEILSNQLDHSMMRRNLSDKLTIAHKSGDLEGIKHDDGIVYTDFGEYIFVMHTWKASSDNYARNIIGDVSSHVYNYFLSEMK